MKVEKLCSNGIGGMWFGSGVIAYERSGAEEKVGEAEREEDARMVG